MVVPAKLECLPVLLLGVESVGVKKWTIALAVAEAGRQSRKRQQLFDDVTSKAQAGKESVLGNTPGRSIDIQIFDKCQAG